MNSRADADRPVGEGAYFSFPNTNSTDQMAIRNRVLDTIRSTNGLYCARIGDAEDGTPVYEPRHGVIKITTWSYNDWGMTDALTAAKKRGVSVQVMAARSINVQSRYKPWMGKTGVRAALGYYSGIVPSSLLNDEANWSHDCPGACRGSAGTPHSKFFLFQDVGTAHLHDVVMQTSMNLTAFAYKGQWNQAKVVYDAATYADFVSVFNQMARQERGGYARFDHADTGISNIFFPKTGTEDPAMDFLDPSAVDCTGRTPVRVINYAFYGPRGVRIANQLRGLWNNGCDVKVIYSLTSKSTLKVLRSRAGRGPIPVKQSVIKNKRGVIKKYNHSKWVGVGDRVMAGSGNWSEASYRDDEQFQQFYGSAPFFDAFDKTWNQSSSRPPKGGRLGDELVDAPDVLRWGRGELKYLTPEG